ncbi:uncharacterized protein MONBRDRAFT_24224 [Monosiga brevicollis MX1]|uniref:MATE efflux family protein n=1 Tax=Monosiga brevicollis TaxID=81824 RepID=A9UVS3_MONBE|nr:uncharacterized protein MONBRDRAFT_24224 [Monosiga brevicollis MX1]EDQ90639.1 predicted protein [Monosiga brevicollis MX1]|eukprot:XP_001744690.1 hypothetical protein [Monosiga brevicollis MX1]
MASEAAQPVAALCITALLGHSHASNDPDPATTARHNVAVYGATQSTAFFLAGLFNFLLTVTLAQLSKAIGARSWSTVPMRLRVALGMALLTSAMSWAIMYGLRSPLLQLFGLSKDLIQSSRAFYDWRAHGLVLLFLTRLTTGILTASKAVWTVALINLIGAGLDVGGHALFLHTASYCLGMAAGQLDLAALAAHQIISQLWNCTSYICDGFADVGTILGARCFGSNDMTSLRSLATQLLCLGFGIGTTVLVILCAARAPIQELFTSDEETLARLRSTWWLLAGMQPINSLVFVFDGILYAVQAFAYKRNIVAAGGFLFYLPLILLAYFQWHGLFFVWLAYAALTLCRFAGAIWKFVVLLRAESAFDM